MPNISYQTPVLDNGNVNPNVPNHTLLLQASGLQPNQNIAVSLTYGASAENWSTQADNNGNLSYSIAANNAIIQSVLSHLGSGGYWNDNASQWMQPFALNGTNFLFSIEAT